MKKIPVIDQSTGEYNLKYNVESVTEDYFLPVRGGDSGTEIETLPGLSNNDQIEDIEYLRNKMMASLRIPKAFLGYEEGLSGGKATLAAEDVRFARTIERLQKIIVSELTKIGIVHLYSHGFNDSDLIAFDLELQNPSMIHEQEKLELMNQQLEIAENTKQKFRLEHIETEGQDPAEQPVGDEVEDEEEMARSDDWGGSEKDPFSGKESQKDIYDSDKVQKRHRSFGKREFKGKSPLATSKAYTAIAREGILTQLKSKFPKSNNSLLSEDNIIED